MKFLMISGKKRVGKNLLAKSVMKHLSKLNEEYETKYAYDEFAFAMGIKLLLNPIAKKLGMDIINNDKDKELFRPVIMQLGKIACEIDNDIWTKSAFAMIKNQKVDIGINTDMRFEKELSYLKEHYHKQDYFIVRIIDDLSDPQWLAQQNYSEKNLDHINENQYNLVIHKSMLFHKHNNQLEPNWNQFDEYGRHIALAIYKKLVNEKQMSLN